MFYILIMLALFLAICICLLATVPNYPFKNRYKSLEIIRCDDMNDNVCFTNPVCCPRFVAYGDESNDDDSVRYFAIPAFRCNDSASGKARYVLEPKPASWTRLKIPGNPNDDVPFDWYCGGITKDEIENEWALAWDPNVDGYITNVCLNIGDENAIYVDSDQNFGCDGNTNPDMCPTNGFVPQLLLFTNGISNGPGNAKDRSDGNINILGWYTRSGGNGDYVENNSTLKQIASAFMPTLELPVRGAPRVSCGEWSQILQAVIETVSCPDMLNGTDCFSS